MVCKEEICAIFQNLQPHKRIDLMCGLLHLCLPLELRFLGSFMEDLGKKDFHYLREHELKANKTCEINDLLENDDNNLRHKLAIYLSLLYSNHGSCSNSLYKVLISYLDRIVYNQKILGNKFDVTVLQEMLTILTIACNHPAFTFEQRNVMYERYRILEQQSHNLQQDIGAILSTDTGPSAIVDNVDNHMCHYHHHQAWNTCIDDVISLSNPLHQETLHRDPPYVMYQTACDSPMSSTTSRSSSPSHSAPLCVTHNAPVCSVTHLLEQLQMSSHGPALSHYSIEQLRNLRDEDFERMQLPYSDVEKIRSRLKLLSIDTRGHSQHRPDMSVPPPGYFPHPPPLLPPSVPHPYPVMVYANHAPHLPLAGTSREERLSNDESSDADHSSSNSQNPTNHKKTLLRHMDMKGPHNESVLTYPTTGLAPMSLPPGYPIDTTYLYRPPLFAFRQPRPMYVARAPPHQIPYLCYPKPSTTIPGVIFPMPPPPIQYIHSAIPQPLVDSGNPPIATTAMCPESPGMFARHSESPGLMADGSRQSPESTISSRASPAIIVAGLEQVTGGHSNSEPEPAFSGDHSTPGDSGKTACVAATELSQDCPLTFVCSLDAISDSASVTSGRESPTAVGNNHAPASEGLMSNMDGNIDGNDSKCSNEQASADAADNMTNNQNSVARNHCVTSCVQPISRESSPVSDTSVTYTVITSATAPIMSVECDDPAIDLRDALQSPGCNVLSKLPNGHGLYSSQHEPHSTFVSHGEQKNGEQKNGPLGEWKNSNYNEWTSTNFDVWKNGHVDDRKNTNVNERKNTNCEVWRNTHLNERKNTNLDERKNMNGVGRKESYHSQGNSGGYYNSHENRKNRTNGNNIYPASKYNNNRESSNRPAVDAQQFYTNVPEATSTTNMEATATNLNRLVSPQSNQSRLLCVSPGVSVQPKPRFPNVNSNPRDLSPVPSFARVLQGNCIGELPYVAPQFLKQRAIMGQNSNRPPSPSVSSSSMVKTNPPPNGLISHHQRPPSLRPPNSVDVPNPGSLSGGQGSVPQAGGKTCYNCGTAGHSAEHCSLNTLQAVAGHYHLNFHPKPETSE